MKEEKRLKVLKVFLLASSVSFLAINSQNANAAKVFYEALVSDYEKPPCSLWHHECGGFPTSWDMNPAGFRIGVEHSNFRVSYFDLGKYGISAQASDNEDCVLAGGGMSCSGDTDWYYTTGSMRGFALTYKASYKMLFVEGGPALFRQAFKLEKSDGYKYQERLWGYGYAAGLGVQYKNVSVGYYVYATKVGAQFENGSSPCGTGAAKVVAVGYKF